MGYSDMPEGYEPVNIPFQPSPRQNLPRQASPVQSPLPEQAKAQPTRMPKARALALVRRMKQGAIVGSLLCFGTVAGLIVNQTSQVAQAAQQMTKSSSQVSAKTSTATTKSATTTSTPAPTATVTTASKNNSTTTTSSSTGTSSQASSTQQGGGYGFGSTQASQPVSSSRTS